MSNFSTCSFRPSIPCSRFRSYTVLRRRASSIRSRSTSPDTRTSDNTGRPGMGTGSRRHPRRPRHRHHQPQVVEASVVQKKVPSVYPCPKYDGNQIRDVQWNRSHSPGVPLSSRTRETHYPDNPGNSRKETVLARYRSGESDTRTLSRV